MKRDRLPPDDPREWIRRATSNLIIAGIRDPQVDLADLCFEAQQCAEKSIKAVFLKRGMSFPYVHDLQRLLRLLTDDGLQVPKYVRESSELTQWLESERPPRMLQSSSRSCPDYNTLACSHVERIHWREFALEDCF